jgi:glucose/arabinose dehydrogenase
LWSFFVARVARGDGGEMDQLEMLELDVKFDNTPIHTHYANVLDIRASPRNELFVTVGSVFPQERAELDEAQEAGRFLVQPTFRFAMSYDTAKKVMDVMEKQMEILEQLRGDRNAQISSEV